MAKNQQNQTPTVTPAAVVSDTAPTFKVAELNGAIVVQDAQGNILAPTNYTDEMKAAVDAAAAAKASADAPAAGDGTQDQAPAGAPQEQPVQDTAASDAALTQKPAEAPVAQIVEPTPEVVVQTPPVTVPPVMSQEFELPLSASASSRMIITELKDYIAKMSSKARLPAQEGGQVQSMLYHVLIQAVNSKAEDFDAVFGMVMKLIRANLKGAFSDSVVHRYTPHVTLPPAAAASLRYLINALTALADPSSEVRKIAKRQINIEQALGSRQIKEDARQRVLAFFNYQ